ncbi:MAG: RNA methyltransferase [Alphaproteobacteria bacterium]
MPPIITLIRPQMGENIGAVARAMANFGLTELRLVAPRDGWPNQRAWEVSSGAGHILDAAKLYADIPAALADIHTAYATTARGRDIAKRVVSPQEAVAEIYASNPHPNLLPKREKELTSPSPLQREGWDEGFIKTAILFGPERTGLENDDIALCDAFITIPTTPDYFSLNLAQAVVIFGYEWFKQGAEVRDQGSSSAPSATKSEWTDLFNQLETYLDEAKFFRVAEKKEIMWNNIRNMLLRGRFSSQEISTLRGMLRVMWEGRKPRSKP